jgi:predicted porin
MKFMKLAGAVAACATAAVMAVSTNAGAADLGGNCCADLEERIAELEATTARKGNRKVSLTVSGQINEAVMFWDDGVEKNAYVVTNESSRSRFRFVGSAKIDAAWSAGYLLEIGVRANRQNNLEQNIDSVKVNGGLDIRHSAWWLQNKDLGKVWVGQTSQATDGITEISLAATGHFAGPQIWDSIGGFRLRGSNGALSGLNVANLGLDNNPGEGARFNVVKYETPTLAGFVASAAWGEDDVWDVALRYAGEANGFKLAAGIGYAQWSDGNENPRICARIAGTGKSVQCDELGMSASAMHVPSGLFVTGLYGFRNDDQRNRIVGLAGTANGTKKRDEVYMVQAGIEKSFIPVGKSTVFGEYWQGNFGAPINGGSSTEGKYATTRALGLAGFSGLPVGSTDISMWGVGFNQNIAAAAMDIYVGYRNYSFDVKDTAGNKAALNDIQVVMTGARIQF